LAKTWIKLYRDIEKWGWYKRPSTCHLFIHLLLRANFESSNYKGFVIKRGQIVTGRKALSSQTGLSERQVRTALTHLESTNDVTIQRTNQFSIISMINYEKYQTSAGQESNERPTTDQRPTTSKELLENSSRILKEKVESKDFDAHSVMNLFNSVCNKKLPKILLLNDKRKRHIKVIGKYILDESGWTEYFNKILSNPFLTGDNNRGWRANFDWIINSSNYLKVMEENYEDSESNWWE